MADQQQKIIPPGDCILFSTADWETPYWTNKQHTARLLAKRGWRVLYVESVGLRSPSISSGRDWGRLFRRLLRGIKALLAGPEKVENNVWVLPPLMMPFKHHLSIIRAFNQGLLRSTISSFLKQNRFFRPLVWTYHPFMLEAISGLEIGPLVYHCVDNLAAVPGVDAQAFNREEQRLLKQCTAVFTTAPALQVKCQACNPNTHYFSNVVDVDHFGRALSSGPLPADLCEIPEPRFVYYGVLSDFKVDFALVLTVARMHPDWHWVFIGEEREGQHNKSAVDLRKLQNVHFIGFRSYDILPEYLRGMSVGLLPTLLNEYTRSMFPMKYYEYLAAGLPVVATPLDFTLSCNKGLESGENANNFALAITKQIKRGRLSIDESITYVGANTWDTRMTNMLNIINEVGWKK